MKLIRNSLQINLQTIDNKVTHHYIMMEKFLSQLFYFTLCIVIIFISPAFVGEEHQQNKEANQHPDFVIEWDYEYFHL